MKPILFQLGPVPVPSYGVMAVLAMVACMIMAALLFARREGLDPKLMAETVIVITIGGLAGARLLELLVSWQTIMVDPRHALTILVSGGVYLGGVIGAIITSYFWYRYHGIAFTQGVDLLGFIGGLSTAVARWGCFLSGCCYGTPTDLPWGVTFPPAARSLHAGLPDAPLHPTQIYLSLAGLAIFIVLVVVHRWKKFHGQMMLLFLMLYGVSRFFLESFRGDLNRGFVFDGLMSTSQFLSILIVAVAGALYVMGLRHAARRGPLVLGPVPEEASRSAGGGGTRTGKAAAGKKRGKR